MAKTLRVLMLGYSEADAELIKHELSRGGLAPVTERVDSEEAFISALREFAPEVVVSDNSVAPINVCATLDLLRQLRPITPLIIVSASANSERTAACVRAGAEDVIPKSSLNRLPASISNAVSIRQPLHRLTPRQIEVLRMVAEGRRTREIAKHLKLSVKTVETHRGEVMKRLGIHDVVSLVRYAARVGLITAALELGPSTA